MRRRSKTLLWAAAALVLVPLVFWYAAVPDSAIPIAISSRAANLGADVKMNNFRKGFLLSFSADSVTAGYRGRPALTIEDVRGRINPLGLFTLRLLVAFKAELSGGAVKGRFAYSLLSGQSRLETEVKGADLAGLPVVKKSRGTLMAHVEYSGGAGREAGSIMFAANNLRNFPYGFTTANGVVDITPEGLKIRSISLDSGEMYANLKGGVHEGTYNIRMEVTAEGQGAAAPNPLLDPYRVSPGYYVIPLSGTFRQLP